MLFRALLLFAFFISLEAHGGITADSLAFKNWAREANDQAFVAELNRATRAVKVTRARYDYESSMRLFDLNSSSIFTVKQNLITLLTDEFYATVYERRKEDAVIRERIWRLRASALESGDEEPLHEIASLHVSLRKKYVAIAATFLEFTKKLAVEAGDLRARAQRLQQQNAMTHQQLNYYIELDAVGQGGVSAAEKELAKCKELLLEAEKDYRLVKAQ